MSGGIGKCEEKWRVGWGNERWLFKILSVRFCVKTLRERIRSFSVLLSAHKLTKNQKPPPKAAWATHRPLPTARDTRPFFSYFINTYHSLQSYSTLSIITFYDFYISQLFPYKCVYICPVPHIV